MEAWVRLGVRTHSISCGCATGVGLYRLLVDRNESGMRAVVFVVSSQLSLYLPRERVSGEEDTL